MLHGNSQREAVMKTVVSYDEAYCLPTLSDMKYFFQCEHKVMMKIWYYFFQVHDELCLQQQNLIFVIPVH